MAEIDGLRKAEIFTDLAEAFGEEYAEAQVKILVRLYRNNGHE